MAAVGSTPIKLYGTNTASQTPLAANLANDSGGIELAVNGLDGKLFYKDNSGNVQVLASKATGSIGGSTTQVQFNNAGVLGGSASLTWSGTVLTSSGFAGPLNGTVGATTPASGSFTTTTIGTSETLSYGTANGVAYLNGSKVLTSGSALTFDGITLTALATASTTGIFKNSSTTAQTYNLVASNDANTTIGFGVQGSSSGTFGMVGVGQPFLGTAASDLNIFNNNASGVIKFGIGSSWAEQMRLNSTGLGIGTSSPAYKLDVITASAPNFIRTGVTSSNAGAGVIFQGAISGQKNWVIANQYNISGGLEFTQTTTNGGSTISSTPSMTLDASGNLGIGTTTPDARLDVTRSGNGQIAVLQTSANRGFSFESQSDTQLQLSSVQTNTNLDYWVAGTGVHTFSTAGTERMRIDSSGNLLVGTTSNANSDKLVVNGGVYQFQTVNGSSASPATNGGYLFGPNSATVYAGIRFVNQILSNNNIAMAFYTTSNAGSATEAGRFDGSGNLLVGTTSALNGAARLDVSALSGNNVAATFKNNAGAIQWVTQIWNAGTSGDNGFVQFATETSYTGRGSISYNRAGGLVAYNTTSDYRAKDIIGPIPNSGALIDSVPVYMGKMKDATQERPMFLAHETPAYAHTGEKDAVDENGNPKYQQMDASALIPVMWAEIQSLRKRLAALEAK
jgi:hypothetical protein